MGGGRNCKAKIAMRVTCPTCETVYEVPPGQLPEDGRHVQCSNCHTRWFARPEIEPEASEDQIIYRLETRASRPRSTATPAPAAESQPETGPQPDLSPAPTSAPVPDAGPAGQPDGRSVSAAQPRDPEPSDVFVWEAAPSGQIHRPAPGAPAPVVPTRPIRTSPPEPPRERDVRGDAPRERPTREALARTPVPAAESRPQASRPPVPDRMRGELAPPPPPRPSELPPRFGRREMPAPEVSLPDGRKVGHHPLRLEIPGAAADDGWDREGLQRPQSRFGLGLLVALLLFGAALGVYGYDRMLVDRAPSLAPAVDAYVGAIDQMRETISPAR